MKANIVFLVGVILLAQGLLFMGQGAGWVHWPAGSFMINQRGWIERGLVVALIGVALIFAARRIRQP